MRHLFLAGIATSILFSIGVGLARGEADFRQANWGMSQEQVKETEPSDKLTGEMPEVLIYEGEIAGIKASIFYLFDEGKLARGLYSIETRRQDTIVADYETIRAFMLKQYGVTAEVKMGPEEEMFTGEHDPNDPEELYSLVLRKSISPETTWDEDNTRIYLRLFEQDGRVSVMVAHIIFPAEK